MLASWTRNLMTQEAQTNLFFQRHIFLNQQAALFCYKAFLNKA
jgi:hypothetical protein